MLSNYEMIEIKQEMNWWKTRLTTLNEGKNRELERNN